MISIDITSDKRAEGKTYTAFELFSLLPDSLLVVSSVGGWRRVARRLGALGRPKLERCLIAPLGASRSEITKCRNEKYVIWDLT